MEILEKIITVPFDCPVCPDEILVQENEKVTMGDLVCIVPVVCGGCLKKYDVIMGLTKKFGS